MSETTLLVVVITLFTAALILLLLRRLRAGRTFGLRPLPAYEALGRQMGLAVESGRRLHVTMGRAPLHSEAGPTSVAALQVLEHLAEAGSSSGIPPRATVGEGTLLPVAQDTLRRAYEAAGRGDVFHLREVEFLADQAFPITYAAGVTTIIHRDDVANNVAVGRFGSEMGILAEAARRSRMMQVLGSDDPTAVALATAFSNNVLWGEELFAAGAYLDGDPAQVASLRAQDVLRWLVSLALLLVALWQLVVG
jgi:hypothetical protein